MVKLTWLCVCEHAWAILWDLTHTQVCVTTVTIRIPKSYMTSQKSLILPYWIHTLLHPCSLSPHFHPFQNIIWVELGWMQLGWVLLTMPDFLGGSLVKNLTAMQKKREMWVFVPWVGKIPWKRKWQPTPLFLLGKSHGQRSLAGYSPWGCKELDMTKWLSTNTQVVYKFMSTRSLRFSMLSCVSAVWSLIVEQYCILCSWAIHSSKDIWVISGFHQLWGGLLYTFVCKFLTEDKFSFL